MGLALFRPCPASGLLVMRYDLLFSGELRPGALPAQVRARLQGLFKLSDEAVGHVFSGRTVALKRGLEGVQAEKLRQIFLDAGALVRLVPQEEAPSAALPVAEQPGPATAAAGDAGPSLNPVEAPAWQLASQDDRPLEPDPGVGPPAVDISRLRLVEGQDWSLADCEPGQPAVVLPDIGHLHIQSLGPEEEPGGSAA